MEGIPINTSITLIANRDVVGVLNFRGKKGHSKHTNCDQNRNRNNNLERNKLLATKEECSIL